MMLIVTYAAQAVVGVALFVIFRYFSGLYKGRFLRTWSWAWFSFTLAMVANLWLTARIELHDVTQPTSILISFISLFCFLFQYLLLSAGTWELLREATLSRRLLSYGSAILLIVAGGLVLAFINDPEASAWRYALRIGLRYLAASLCFITISYLLYKRKAHLGIGYRIMSVSMFLVGSLQLYYLAIVVSYLLGRPLEFPALFGIIDLLLMSGIGIGMLIGLLEDEREKLRKANQELDSFLYSTSHDLRAPIASVLGLTNIARMDTTDARALEIISMIEGRVKKLDAVIGDILSLSRGKKAELRLERISLTRLVDEVVTDVKFAQDAPAIRLIFDREPEFFFVSDFAMMKTVVGNLFSNGVKYHRINQADPFIKVTASRSSSVVTLRIEDNGQGIRPENQARIFDMFYRASSQSEGTGLGLFIVRESLARLDGQINVKSEFGMGSVFTITLPARTPE